MLSAIRAFAKSWIAWIIFGALLISFALVGNVRDMIAPSFGTWIVSAGSRKVEPVEFKRMYENAKNQQEQRIQQPISVEMAVQMGLDRFVINEIASQESLSEMLRNMGIRPDNALVEAEIQKQQAFFSQVTGAFDRKTYIALLAEHQLTPAKFEQGLRDEIAFNHFGFGVGIGMRLPRAYTATFATLQLEARDGVFFVIDAKTVGVIPLPTDAEMLAFIAQRKLMAPELRTISVVKFSAKDEAATAKVDEAEVQKVYNFRKDSLSTPEKRSLVQISVKDQATAASVSARLQKGEDPAVVAKSLKVEPIVLTEKPKSALSDRRVGEAAFKLAAGQVSGPIQGDLAWAVVKVIAITPGTVPTLEEARPQIEEELKAAAAQKAAYALSERYDEAHNAGAALPEAAAKAGAKVITLGPVSKEGANAIGKPVEGVDPKVLEAAFSLPQGGESDIVDGGEGEYFAVRVDKVTPSAPFTLDQVRPDLTKVMMQQRLAEKLGGKAKELQARIRKGESLEAVAASVGAKVVHVVGIDRASAENHAKDLGQGFLEAMIQGKAGEVFIAPAPDNKAAVMVGRIDVVRQGDMGDMARFTETLRPQIGMQYFEELRGQIAEAAKKSVGTKTDINRARAALGMSQEDIAKLDAKKTDKAGAKKK